MRQRRARGHEPLCGADGRRRRSEHRECRIVRLVGGRRRLGAPQVGEKGRRARFGVAASGRRRRACARLARRERRRGDGNVNAQVGAPTVERLLRARALDDARRLPQVRRRPYGALARRADALPVAVAETRRGTMRRSGRARRRRVLALGRDRVLGPRVAPVREREVRDRVGDREPARGNISASVEALGRSRRRGGGRTGGRTGSPDLLLARPLLARPSGSPSRSPSPRPTPMAQQATRAQANRRARSAAGSCGARSSRARSARGCARYAGAARRARGRRAVLCSSWRRRRR